MINTPGNDTVIVDSDGLIGLIHSGDLLYHRCQKILHFLKKKKYILFTPYPIVLEAATALTRKKNMSRPDLASRILKDYSSEVNFQFFTKVEPYVAQLYDPKTSSKNTPFDHYILALAKKNNIPYVFSFDSFYKKNGLTLIEEIVK